MAHGRGLRSVLMRLTTRRYRRILIACGLTLMTSATLLALISFARWRGHQALQSDTRTILAQAGQQLVRTLQSRRGTLTFLRDTLNRRSDLTLPQLQAMGTSAKEHTRHLLGTGLVRSTASTVWWGTPRDLSPLEVDQVSRAITARTKLRGIWRVPSTFMTTLRSSRPVLVMLEPLRSGAFRESAVVGVFDVRTLLEDFFASSVPPRYPVQLLDGQRVLYRSTGWRSATTDERPILEASAVNVDATRWTIQMQPGSTRVVQTLSSFHVLLVGLSVLAGLGVTSLVWILAARTWILQRAVARRTAALRRTSERLRQLATTDALTGLYNRRFFLDRLAWEYDRAKRYGRPLACLMIDVNGFKQVNDHLGHALGDLVLKRVAEELRLVLRQSDILARFGGDEFVIALPETGLEQAESVVQKLRQLKIPITEAQRPGCSDVTLSVGLSRVREADESAEDILEAADQSLYAYKRRAQSASAHS